MPEQIVIIQTQYATATLRRYYSARPKYPRAMVLISHGLQVVPGQLVKGAAMFSAFAYMVPIGQALHREGMDRFSLPGYIHTLVARRSEFVVVNGVPDASAGLHYEGRTDDLRAAAEWVSDCCDAYVWDEDFAHSSKCPSGYRASFMVPLHQLLGGSVSGNPSIVSLRVTYDTFLLHLCRSPRYPRHPLPAGSVSVLLHRVRTGPVQLRRPGEVGVAGFGEDVSPPPVEPVHENPPPANGSKRCDRAR